MPAQDGTSVKTASSLRPVPGPILRFHSLARIYFVSRALPVDTGTRTIRALRKALSLSTGPHPGAAAATLKPYVSASVTLGFCFAVVWRDMSGPFIDFP